MAIYQINGSSNALNEILKEYPQKIVLEQLRLNNTEASNFGEPIPYPISILGQNFSFVVERLPNGNIWLIDEVAGVDFYLSPLK